MVSSRHRAVASADRWLPYDHHGATMRRVGTARSMTQDEGPDHRRHNFNRLGAGGSPDPAKNTGVAKITGPGVFSHPEDAAVICSGIVPRYFRTPAAMAVRYVTRQPR